MTVYSELGVRPIINAATTWTVLGGSLMPPEVLDAMRDAAQAFVDMHELQEAAGRELARLTNNAAAYVTGGAAAGIVLGVLAGRTRGDLASIGRLLEGAGSELPDEVIMHTAHRIPYDPAVRFAGARIRPIGNVLQTFDWELEAAITPRTAAVLHVIGSFVAPGALDLATVVKVAHAHDVPVIVDAAAQLPPVSSFWRFTREVGADIAIFSGGKELRGPQSSGLIVGRARWIEAIRTNGAPHQRLARAMKVGKEEIAGLVVAVRRFVKIDHEQAWADLHERCTALADALSGLDGVKATVEDTNAAGARIPRVMVALDPRAAGRNANSVAAALREGDPRIAVRVGKGEYFHVQLDLLTPSEEVAVRSRLVEVLSAS
jgi:L-seryl-tRNA(Ser) seleniumtransferase